MLSEDDVKQLFADHLDRQAHQRFESAGDLWPEMSMGFFFPQNEDTVDLFALEVLDAALKADGLTVPNQVRNSLRNFISLTTIAKHAVTTIFLTTVPTVPKEN
jgi:hypothetical protein